MSQSLDDFCQRHNPDLLSQWHSDKNGDLTPKEIAAGSHKKVWWQCPKGHVWLANVSNRVKGNGCPICSNKRAAAGVNDFATVKPELLVQWHPTKNAGRGPVGLACNSQVKAWWRCGAGHEWQAAVASRFRGNGCPICSNKKVVPGINDLLSQEPELAAQWHPVKNNEWTPSHVSLRSGRKVWWLCERGHEWQATVVSRCHGNACPICSNRKIVAGVNDLAWVLPELAAQWHPTKNSGLSPEQVAPHSGKRVWWRCEQGHEWQAVIASRVAGNGCPVCSNRKIVEGVNDLTVTRPDLAAQWHPTRNGKFTPQQVSLHSGKSVWWTCEQGHEWQAAVATRVSGCGCPYCAGIKPILGKTDLASTHPALARQWHPVKNGLHTPSMVSSGSGKKAWWQCEQGHAWQAVISSRVRGNGCPYCSGRRVIPGETDLATTAPGLAAQWHPAKNGALTARNIKAKSGRQVWWLCAYGHEWTASPLKRSQGRGCPYCAKRRVIPQLTSLAAARPALARQWHPHKNGMLTPDQVSPGSGRKAWWVCERGHTWLASIHARCTGTGCPVCAHRQVLRGFNDLASVNPQLAQEWHPTKNGSLTPADVAAHSNRKVWWQCIRGHEWYGSINGRWGKNGCAACSAELQTSFAEQAIFLYVSRCFTAYNRYVFQKREIDVYIPSLSIGIEHDGWFHESNRIQASDRRKDALLRDNGISLIRVKTGNVCSVDPVKMVIGYCDKNTASLEWAIRQVFGVLEQVSGVALSVDIDVERDRSKIYQQYILLEKERSLLVKAPDAEQFWHPKKNGALLPSHFSAGSGKYIWWQCGVGHEWESTAASFAQGRRCPYCTGRKLLKGFNDLATTNPRLAREWHPSKNGTLRPEDVKPFSNQMVWWICREGHEWRNTVSNRSNGKNCPICASQQVLAGYNDFASKKPQLAAQWHPVKNGALMPWDVTVRSGRKVWWQCERGHEWQARVADRAFGYGCPFCCGRRAIRGVNDLAAQNPVLAGEWHPGKNGDLTPEDVKPFSHHRVWWRCRHGHIWQETVANRSGGRGCPHCARETNSSHQ